MLYALYPRIARILRILMLLHSPSAGQLMRCNQIHEGMMVRMIQGSSSMDIDKRKQYDNACRSYCKEETGAKHSNEYCIEADSIEKGTSENRTADSSATAARTPMSPPTIVALQQTDINFTSDGTLQTEHREIHGFTIAEHYWCCMRGGQRQIPSQRRTNRENTTKPTSPAADASARGAPLHNAYLNEAAGQNGDLTFLRKLMLLLLLYLGLAWLPAVGAKTVFDLAAFAPGITGFPMKGSANDLLGSSVSRAGDFNGDGFADIVVSAPTAERNGQDHLGAVYVLLGHNDTRNFTSLTTDTFITGPAGFHIFGETSGDNFGWVVSAAGDHNGDGYDDLIIGTPFPSSNTGKAYVIFGQVLSAPYSDIDLSTWAWGTQGYIISSSESGCSVGVSVSGAGDVNADGIDDIIVGANFASHGAFSRVGTATVLFGQSQAATFADVDLLAFAPGSAGFVIHGGSFADFFGSSVTAAGDVDGDGYADLLAATSEISVNGHPSVGAGYVVFGHSGTERPFAAVNAAELNGTLGFQLVGGQDNGYLGNSICGAGDVNADGYDDVAISSIEMGHVDRPGGGMVFVVYGHSNATAFVNVNMSAFVTSVDTGFRIFGAQEGDNLGSSLGRVGDVSGDGHSDLVIGAAGASPYGRSAAGATYVILGGNSTDIDLLGFASGPQGYVVYGANAAAESGGSVSGAGDFNGDGVEDVIIGAARAYRAAKNDKAGEVFVLLSLEPFQVSDYADIDLAVFTPGSGGLAVSGRADDELGTSVSGAGDFNGDGIDDIITGAPSADRDGLTNVGVAYVIFGRSATTALENIYVGEFTSGAAGFAIRGERAGNFLGQQVSGAGDVNGDSYDDVAVASFSSTTFESTMYVLFGHSQTTPFTDVVLPNWPWGSQGFIIHGVLSFSYGLSNAGDVNGDGYADVIVGFSEVDFQGRSEAGVAVVILGHSDSANFENVNVTSFASGPGGFIIGGAMAGDRIGGAVGAAGDFNGDGFADVVVGTGGSDSFRAFIVFGHSAGEGFVDVDTAAAGVSGVAQQISHTIARDQLGTAVSGAGDMNADGYGDVLISASASSEPGRVVCGIVYVIYGHSNRTSFPTLSTDAFETGPATGFRIIGGFASDHVGDSLRRAGDINSDGKSDIIIGAAVAEASGLQDAGVAYVIFGGASVDIDLLFFTSGAVGYRILGAEMSMLAGSSVSWAGDFNNDGVDDVVIGAPAATFNLTEYNAGQAFILLSAVTALPTPTSQPSSQPSVQPSGQPSSWPSAVPSDVPTSRPSMQPSLQPSAQPSGKPTTQPSCLPTMQPSAGPTAQPSLQPSSRPSAQPSQQPMGQPSSQPSGFPTSDPTAQPSAQPSAKPSSQPSGRPSCRPTGKPSSQPSSDPTAAPSFQPTSQPSRVPTAQPSRAPSAQPVLCPTAIPSAEPTRQPSRQPTSQPTGQPSTSPSHNHNTVRNLNLTVIAAAVRKTEVELSVLVSGSPTASVHCAAFRGEGYRLQSSATLFSSASSTVVDESIETRIVVAGLSPSTSYVTYCTASTPLGRELSWADVQRTRRSVETSCCKTLAWQVLVRSVRAGSTTKQPVGLTLSDLPSDRMLVALSTGTPSAQFYPATLVVRNTSAVALAQSMYLSVTASATVNVTVALSGPSADEYTVVTQGSSSIQVIGTTARSPAPLPVSAQFTSDGSYVRISFDSRTDKGGFTSTFPCRSLLSFAGDAVATCVWVADNAAAVYPFYNSQSPAAVLTLNSNITVLAGMLRAQCVGGASCSDWETTSSSALAVRLPTDPARPAVIMAAPAQISGCGSYLLDLTASSGSAGRPWQSVLFQVRTLTGTSATALKLEQFLQRNYTLYPPTEVPSSVLSPSASYTIQVTLCNFLGACGAASKTLTVSPSLRAVPVVNILGSAFRSVSRTDTLVLNGEAFTQQCSGFKSYANLAYFWFASMIAGSTDATGELRSASQNPAVFKVLPYTLQVGAEYAVRLTVNSTESGMASSATVRVGVASGDLIAVLAGSSRQSVQVADTVTLDASASYDQDYPDRTGIAAGLLFEWTCVQTAPAFNATCPIALARGAYGKVVSVVPLSALHTASVVTVSVLDGRSRSASTQVEITVRSAPAPRLQIINSPASLLNIDTGKPLALLGSLTLLSPCTARWSVDDQSIPLSSVARTPSTEQLHPVPGGSALPFNLVISPGNLPQRASLAFSLQCDNTSASVTVTTNGAPLPGQFQVNPPSGDEFTTAFAFSAFLWSDPDLPLTYQFGFQSATSLANLVILSRSELSFTSTKLPAGGEKVGFALTCVLSVFDSLGASVDKFEDAVVRPIDESARIQVLQDSLRGSAGTVDGTKLLIAVVSTALNSVNCSTAPNCTERNRGPCVKTTGQCGACLPGFVGDVGDRNALCMPVYALTNATVQQCEADSGCPYWQQCNRTAGLCEDIRKACASNCSGHGSCIFVNRLYGTLLSPCPLSNVDCDAVCACEGHYTGEFCEIDSSTLQRHREIRSNLIGSLSNLTQLEDINPESVASWSASLYSLSIRPHDLSVNDVRAVTAIANATLLYATALGVQNYRDMMGVLQATDAVASLVKYNYNPNDYDVTDFEVIRNFRNNTAAEVIPVLTAFGELVIGAQVLGEPKSEFKYDNFQLDAAVMSATRVVTVDAPQTDVEDRIDRASSTVTFQPLPSGDSTELELTMSVMNPRAYTASTAAFISTPVAVQVQVRGTEVTAVDEVLSDIEFTFQHNEPQDHYVHYTSANLTTTCTKRNASQQFLFVCPDSGHVLRHNCSQGAGVQTSYCPRPASACARLDYISAGISLPSTCRVTDYNATYTTCRCTLKEVPHSRRLLDASSGQSILDDSGAADMMVSTVYIASNFADTFHSANDLTSPGAAAKVIVVIILLGTLWVPAILFMGVDGFRPTASKGRKNKHTAADAKARVLRYVQTVIPAVYASDTPILTRLWMEIAAHHTLFCLFTTQTARKRRETICRMLTVLTFMLFLTAVFFDVSNPGDDGSCVQHQQQSACLHRTSAFDGGRTLCRWSDQDSCEYNSERMSMKALFYLTVLTTVLTSIATVPVDYCFQILSAPTAQSLKGSKVMDTITAVVDGARRMSNVGLAAANRRMTSIVAVVPAALHAVTKKPPVLTFLGVRLSTVSPEGTIANRTLTEDFESFAEEAHVELQAVAATARASSQQMDETARSKRLLQSAVGASAELPDLAQAEDHLRSPEAAIGQNTSPLLAEILLQRHHLNKLSEEAAVFDAQWGITQAPGRKGDFIFAPLAEHAITETIAAVEGESKELSGALSCYSVKHAGLEILHLFMLDLLGKKTTAAKIFNEKFGEEFQISRVVDVWQKYAAGTLLVCLNAFFMYFILLKGLQKGQAWQLQYLVCAVIQVAVDVLVFETTECVWLNFFVPRTVNTEVVTAATTLTNLAEQVTRCENPARKYLLDAPAYLFVSVRLARAHPQLSESLIVRSYTSPLPGEVCKTWPHYQMAAEQREVAVTKSLFPRSFLRGLTLAVQVCLTIPYLYQRILLRFAQPVIFSAISVVWFAAIQSTASIAALCAVSAATGAAALWHWRKALQQNPSTVAPFSRDPTVLALMSAACSPEDIRGTTLEETGPESQTIPAPMSLVAKEEAADAPEAADRDAGTQPIEPAAPSSVATAGLAAATMDSDSEDSMIAGMLEDLSTPSQWSAYGD